MNKTIRIRKSADDRKAEILQTTLRLAFEVGPDMVTTGMIAREMGVTQPSLYKHFQNKEKIWIEVAEYLTARIRENLDRCRAADIGPDERIRMQVMDHLELVEENPALPEIMVLRDLHNSQSVLRDQILESMTTFHSVLVENVCAAQEQGIFRKGLDASDAASLILGIIQSLVLRMMLSRDTSILRREGERLLELQLAGFMADRTTAD